MKNVRLTAVMVFINNRILLSSYCEDRSWDYDDEVHFAEVAKVQALAAAVCYSTHLG